MTETSVADDIDTLKLTERLYAIAASADWDAVREMLHEDFVATEAPGLPFAGEYRGRDGLRELFTKVMSTLDITGLDLLQMTAGGDWVIALVEMVARDAAGEFRIPLAEATRFRDGKVCEIRPYYFDPALVQRAVRAAVEPVPAD